MTKKITVATVDARKFVEDILDLGSKGGKLDDSCIAYKGMFLRAEVLVPFDTIVELNERVSVSAEYIAQAVTQHSEVATPAAKDAVQVADDDVVSNDDQTPQDDPVESTPEVYTREQLEVMSIKQVKEATGLTGRDKEKMIAEYLKDKIV